MRQHKLLWASSYDRGLMPLLKMWPEIKRKYPDATLSIAYGWDLFDKIAGNNPERMEWKGRMEELMKADGITHHGRIGKLELMKLRQECGILAYCSDFTEIFCITAFEAQRDGCVPVTTDIAALGEFIKGRVIVKGDIYDNEVREEYLKQLLSLMDDEERWKELQKQGESYASDYEWDMIANDWTKTFTKKETNIKVSIITPTNRKGFWNIMANNIYTQTYKNVEWVIIDDYPEDRSAQAYEYSMKYQLSIKYVRGKDRATKRRYGLVNANNTGLQVAKGELLVILQDFILMPKDGIEQLVNLYRKNPNAIIAPVDRYFKPKIKPNTESEDWFNGELDVVGDFIWQNPRINNQGLRESQNPFEFEQNYGAIPKHIAESLGGWYEVMDEGLGFDNTDFALRALMAGYKLLVDETNVATCIDHWEALKGSDQHGGMDRARRLNDPRFLFLKTMFEQGKLPIKRTQEIDDKVELLYTVPKEVKDDDIPKYVRDNMQQIVEPWLKQYQGGIK